MYFKPLSANVRSLDVLIAVRLPYSEAEFAKVARLVTRVKSIEHQLHALLQALHVMSSCA